MAVASPVFHPSLPPKPHGHRPGDDFAQKFDRCIRVAAGRVGLWGGASPPKTSQERWPPIRPWQNESAAGRGAPGRDRSVARLVGCQRAFLDFCALFEFRTQTGPSSIGPKAVFFSNFYSISKNITPYSIAFLVKGPRRPYYNPTCFFPSF